MSSIHAHLGLRALQRHAVSLAVAMLTSGGLICIHQTAQASPSAAEGRSIAPGYFRQATATPAGIVFVAEGDLWLVPQEGGVARRLTSHPGEENFPSVSPDGQQLAFVGRYEGPAEVYVMPLAGGQPRRVTVDADRNVRVDGWSPDGRIVITTARHSGKPDARVYLLDPKTGDREALPLAEAGEVAWVGPQLVFTREPQPTDNVIGYVGGRRQQLWSWTPGREAVPAFAGHPGTSRRPVTDGDQVYFLSDKEGRLNVWQARLGASGALEDARAITRFQDDEVRSLSLVKSASGIRLILGRAGRIERLDPKTGAVEVVPVHLASDFDALRPRMITHPSAQVEGVALSPTGDRVAVQARGYISVFPVGAGRRVDVVSDSAQRARDLTFSADGKSLYFVSDATGELEFWQVPTNGSARPTPLTKGSEAALGDPSVSPDGSTLAYRDAMRQVWLLDIKSGTKTRLHHQDAGEIDGLTWSPDGQHLVLSASGSNEFQRLWLFHVPTGQRLALTSDRYHARDAVFSPDSKVLYFLSDRHLSSTVPAPWGQRDPAPYFNHQAKVYGLLLDDKARWPFQPKDEFSGAKPDADKDKPAAKPADGDDKSSDKKPERASAQVAKSSRWMGPGLTERLYEVPVAPGNYTQLGTDGRRLYLTRQDTPFGGRSQVVSVAIEAASSQGPQLEVMADGVQRFDLSRDGKKLMLTREGSQFQVVDAGPKAPADPGAGAVSLRDWTIALDPRAEWRQIFRDTWRMHRDKVHTATMKAVDWQAARRHYEPMVERVTDRLELNDVLAQMTAHVGILHSQTAVRELRRGQDEVETSHLAADFAPVDGGLKVTALHSGDPELLEERSPLARPEAGIQVGDVVQAVNHQPVAHERDLGLLLRGQAGKPVLLSLRSAKGETRQVLVQPVAVARDNELRYLSWEWDRKRRVEKLGAERIGYLHLQAMGKNDIARWAREYYPVFEKEGLIIDLRNNGGGNIDRWILEKLLRRPWVWWQQGNQQQPVSNPPYAVRGNVVAIIDGDTYSDGETFALGLQRLGIATLIGTPTSGAGMWLSDTNTARDKGIARAASSPQFVVKPDGSTQWVVEGVGVKPDVEVDNPPHASFKGQDAQLEAAVKWLLQRMGPKDQGPPKAPAGGAQGSRYRGFGQ